MCRDSPLSTASQFYHPRCRTWRIIKVQIKVFSGENTYDQGVILYWGHSEYLPWSASHTGTTLLFCICRPQFQPLSLSWGPGADRQRGDGKSPHDILAGEKPSLPGPGPGWPSPPLTTSLSSETTIFLFIIHHNVYIKI